MPMLADNVRNLYAALVIAAIIVATLVLGRDILIPLAISTCLAFVLTPLINWLLVRRIPHALAVAGIVISFIITLGSLSTLFATQIVSLAADLGTYKSNLVQKVRTFSQSAKSDGVLKRASDALGSIGDEITKEIKSAPTLPPSGPLPQIQGQSAPQAKDTASNSGTQPPTVVVKFDDNSQAIWDHMSLVAHPLAQVGLTLLFTLFMLLQRSDLRDRIIRIVGTDNISGTSAALDDAAERLSQLFLAQAVMNVGFGIFVGIALWIIGVPNSLLWGGLTILMRFIPYIGSLIAAVPPVLLAAAVDPGWGMALAALTVFLIGEPIMGHVVEPLVLGPKAGLSPFAMLMSASFWALLWGPVGLILAAPLTMTLVVLGRYLSGLEFLTVLLGDEPALSPQEQLYHRLLADDALGAAQQLATSDEKSGLVSLGETLVLPALHLAANDFDRGHLDRLRAERLMANTAELAHLYDYSGVVDGAIQSENRTSILMVPARTMIDVAAAHYCASAIRSSVSADVEVPNRNTGLSALSHAALESSGLSAIVVVTAGKNDLRYLPLITKRAERLFPQALITVLDLSGMGGSEGTSPNHLGRVSVSLVALIEQIRHVPFVPRARVS